MRSIRSHKYQETISFYEEDIDWCGCGKWIAPGVGDATGNEYDVIFDEEALTNGEKVFSFRDVVLHNTN